MRPRLDCDRSATGSSPGRRFFGARPLGWGAVPGYDDDLRLAHVLADAVERITIARFRAEDLRVETKPDLTLVSDADRDAEELIRAQLKRTRPRDAVIGEEFATTGSSPRQWVVDPIDGTHNFVRGRAGVGDPHLARRRRHAGHRPGRGAGPGPALVGGPGLRRLGRPQPDLGQADPRVAGVAGSRTPRSPARAGPRGGPSAARTRCSTWPGPAGASAPTATSGRTCCSPRARSTSRPSPSSACTTWRPWCRSSPRPAAGSPRWPGVDGPLGGNAVATNGLLHDEVLADRL